MYAGLHTIHRTIIKNGTYQGMIFIIKYSRLIRWGHIPRPQAIMTTQVNKLPDASLIYTTAIFFINFTIKFKAPDLVPIREIFIHPQG